MDFTEGKKVKKRFCIGVLILMLLFTLIPGNYASAALVVSPLSSYCLGDEIYSFTKVQSGYDVGQFRISVQSEDMEFTGATEYLPVKETDTMVRYIFLIDRSSSMSYHMDKINAYIASIMEHEKQNAFYTIAAFGEKFEIVKENLTDKNAVKNTLDSFSYQDQMTDPYSGIESALTFLDGISRKSGDIIHLILITDGVPDFDNADGEVKEEKLAKSAAKRILHSPEILVSTLCTGKWNGIAEKTFKKGKGVHSVISNTEEAKNAGKKATSYIDKLYRLKIKLKASPVKDRVSCRVNLMGTTADGQMANFDVELTDVANLKMFSNQEFDESDETELPEAPEDFVLPGTTEEPSETELPDGTELPDDTKKPAPDVLPEGGVVSDGAVSGDSITTSGTSGKSQIPLWLIITVGSVIVVLILIIVILLCKNKKIHNQNGMTSGARPVTTDSKVSGIAMRLEVHLGHCANKEMRLSLADELTIGSDDHCDIVFKDSCVSPVNTRIVFKNGMIYVEDMNSASGTAIGGMKIQGLNRLRSGDMLSIGEVEFCLKF